MKKATTTVRKTIGIKDIKPEDLGKNPFLLSLVVPLHKVPFQGYYKKSNEKAADGTSILVQVEVWVDAQPHCKVFNDAQRRKIVTGISGRAKELFLWILYMTASGKDYISINRKTYMKENGINSNTTYVAAVKELVLGGILQRTMADDVYWLNPEIFFCGSRKNSFPENCKKK